MSEIFGVVFVSFVPLFSALVYTLFSKPKSRKTRRKRKYTSLIEGAYVDKWVYDMSHLICEINSDSSFEEKKGDKQ